MPIIVSDLIGSLQPERTVLLFGAGSSIPSNAPSVADLQRLFEEIFGVSSSNYNLAEQTAIIEHQTGDRRRLIDELRPRFVGRKPTGAILNLPLFPWKSIFTTNYDQFIEESYSRRDMPLAVYSSNFDFGIRSDPRSTPLFKIHGTIDKDVSRGDQSRIILTANDYDLAYEFREFLFDRLKADLAGSHLIVIGHSLTDPDIKSVIDRALALNAKSGGSGRITIFSYTKDEGRAVLLESRGLSVCFGGLDDFFSELTRLIVSNTTIVFPSNDPLDGFPALRPTTIDASHQQTTATSDVSAMFNGWPATYADISAGLTFSRNISDEIYNQVFAGDKTVAILLGPSGVGKTTVARQVIVKLLFANKLCWEHKLDQTLRSRDWRSVGQYLKSHSIDGYLFIDEAHAELSHINDLIDYLAIDENFSLRLILVSSTNQWYPRIKTPALNRSSQEYILNRIQGNEVDKLISLAENVRLLGGLLRRGLQGFLGMREGEG